MEMKTLAIGAVCIGLNAGIASAAAERVSGAGDTYVASVNEDGFILTSKYPKSRFVEQGAGSYVIEGREKFYFGRSCDVYHKHFGYGTWGWANGGFSADFDTGFSLRFPRQDVPYDGGLHCRL